MFGIGGPWEILIVLAIVLLLFGGKRIPTLMRSMGQSIVEFKKGIKGIEEDQADDSDQDDSASPKP